MRCTKMVIRWDDVMLADTGDTPSVNRVLVEPDRAKTADGAVGWALRHAAAHHAELLLLQVLPPEGGEGAIASATAALQHHAAALAGARGRARVVVHADPAQAILDVAADERVDVVVVGNVGMRGRQHFLL